MNNMFTDGVKRVMQFAREESARLGHNYIGTEHLLLGIIITLSVFVPLMPGPPADPLSTPEGIKPEWYFLPMFQLLKYLPEPVAVGLPGLAGLLIFLLPFYLL